MMKNSKKNQRGFTHNIALLVLGVFVLGVVGFAGFKVYKSKNDASAAYSTLMMTYFNAQGQKATPSPYAYPVARACYTPINSGYGPLYRVQATMSEANLPASLKTKTGFVLSTFANKDQPPTYQYQYAWPGSTITLFVPQNAKAGFNVSYIVGSYGGATFSSGGGGRALVTSLGRC